MVVDHHKIGKYSRNKGKRAERELALLCHGCHEKIHNRQPIWIHSVQFKDEEITAYLKEYIKREEDTCG